MRRFIFGTLAVFTFIALLGFASKASAEVDTWTKKADMPTARQYLATSTVGGKIYAIGGYDGSKADYSYLSHWVNQSPNYGFRSTKWYLNFCPCVLAHQRLLS